MPPQRQKQNMDHAYTYIRMFYGSLCSYGLLMLLCTSPLNWVRFLVTSNGLELYAGLWTLCNHEQCWSHIPKPPYYIQYSRACFILSILITLSGLGWLFSSCFPRGENMITNLDLKVSVLNFMSAICLLFCLYLFLEQVHWQTRYAMDADFLWPYYLNWLSDILYMCAGILSFVNYLTSRLQFPDENVTVVPAERPRLGIGPVTPLPPARAAESYPYQESLKEREHKLPSLKEREHKQSRLKERENKQSRLKERENKQSRLKEREHKLPSVRFDSNRKR